jgi:mRNA interferase MazF
MSKQIAVRLDDDLVAFVDEIVQSGRERSRAAVVTRALERERRRIIAAETQRSSPAPDPTPSSPRWPSTPSLSLSTPDRPMHLAPLTTTIRGLSTEVLCGTANGLEDRCVVTCHHITTIPSDRLGRQIGRLLDDQETGLTRAFHAAFDLDTI